MRNVKLTLSYDGSDFCGYQIQKGFRSVQEEIQKALSEILQDDITVIGAGRTDSGVHALAQVVNFHHNKNISPKNFVTGLNHFLPDDIRIISAKEVDLKFHSRFDAISKTYEYVIFNDVFMPPIYRKYKEHIPYKLDLSNMEKSLEYFCGEHDFSAFRMAAKDVVNPIRTVDEFNMEVFDKEIIFTVKGRSFLRNMVRIMVGTVIDVGLGTKSFNEIESIIESKDRSFAGRTLGACGLYLKEIVY